MAKKSEQEKAAAAVEGVDNGTAKGIDFDKLREREKTIDEILREFEVDTWDRVTSNIWRPEEGEFRIGTYESNKVLPPEYSDFDEDVNIHYFVDAISNERVSFVGGKMCDLAILEAEIGKGDMIYVAYTGKGETRKGNKVNNWDIRVKR
jgi:hypothetical protein